MSSGKSSSSGNLGSGRDTLTVGKISSSGNHITSSGNALVGDEAVYKELGNRMERAVTTASSLEAKQDSGNI
ncbi:hypothetical protein Tco_0249621 [Tanacetum coccineum]